MNGLRARAMRYWRIVSHVRGYERQERARSHSQNIKQRVNGLRIAIANVRRADARLFTRAR